MTEKSEKCLILGAEFHKKVKSKHCSQIGTSSTNLKEDGHCMEAAVAILALKLVSVAKSPKVNREYTG